MKAGKTTGKAALRTLANKGALNFATRRLLKDMDEIKNNAIPTVGVTAEPLEDNLFLWHGNIKGPEGTEYEGGVFHIEITIPQSYPQGAPTVEILGVDLPHPNVFGRSICLDMLNNERGTSRGWSSGYTILSVLIQLQSFLFEKFYDTQDRKLQIKKAIETANQYKCSKKSCKHGGKLAAWPAFNVKETTEESFKVCESEKQLFEKELVCYHTKLTHNENALGLGLTISRVPRTGLIKQASPCLDYISLKAFIKEGVRVSSTNEKFTHWLPLYFGANKDRTLHLAKKAISMICTSHTKRFKEELVLDVFPKILITLAFQMMDEKRHCSIRILRILAHAYCLYLLFIETYPNLMGEIEKQMTEFVKDENKRTKDNIANLGAFLSNLMVAFKMDQKEVFSAFVEEQMDRQVFWMMRTIPELEELNESEHLDEHRAKICFKHESTAYHITLFFKVFTDFIRENFKGPKEALDHLADNLGRFPDKQENLLQKKLFDIVKVDSHEKYFEYLGLGKIDGKALNARLKQAVANSRRKKYHGTDDEILQLPSSEEQLKSLHQKLPKFEDFLEKDKKGLRKATEDEWKKAAIDRWMWIKEVTQNNTEIKACHIARMSDTRMQAVEFRVEEELVTLKNNYLKDLSKSDLTPQIIQRYPETFTWCELFLKLDIENHLMDMDQNPDFHLYYDKLKIGSELIKALVIPIQNIKNLKSGHHYLTALLTNLTHLKHIEIIGMGGSSQLFNLAALKAIAKGFNNFVKNGGSLKEISYGPFAASSADNRNEMSEKLFLPINLSQDLITLSIRANNMMSFNGGKALSKVITDHKNILELNLSGAGLTREIAKDLADGLMRAKQLQKVDISNNSSITHTGLASIIYNLAFSPKLVSLNISNNALSSGQNEVVESIYKLLRISASLEVLLMNRFSNINAYLNKDFFVALGEVRTLKVLDISWAGSLNSTSADFLGKAIAFNARLKGSLEMINLEGGVVPGIHLVNTIYQSMHVSDYDHEAWYGDVNKLNKMQGKDFEKVYYNNLKVLQLKGNNIPTSFNYANWKKQFNPQDPDFVKLLARSSKVENVQLAQCNLNKNDADALVLALDPTRPNYTSNIRVLNLARNNLGKEGVKTLAAIFEKNHTIEALDLSGNKFGVSGAQTLAAALANNKSVKFLNIFANKIDVDGARAFEKAFKTNNTLEFIDFGHNRLRDEGLMSLARGLASNPNSGIKNLGLRFNFITEDGVIEFFKKVYASGKYTGKLYSLYLKNNNISEFGLYNIIRIMGNYNVKLHLDVLDKMRMLDAGLLERTVWIHPASIGTPQQVKNFFENTQKCGIVLDVRRRKGPKWANRSVAANDFYFVEFAHPVSVTRALHVASKRQATLGGINFRIYKAGSGTYFCKRFLTIITCD